MSDDARQIISLAALTVLEVSPLDAARIAAACGYSHIGLRPVAATQEEQHFPILSDRGLEGELARTLSGEGIGVLDVEIVRLKPEMDWTLLDRVLAFAQRFGCARLLVADNDPDPDRSSDNLSELALRAAAYGVTPCLEFMPWTAAPDLPAARQRIADIANCGLLVDAFHLARSGGTSQSIEPGDPAINYIQLCDISGPVPAMDEILREARGDRLFPGEGEIDLIGLLQRLRGLPLSLEVPADRLRDSGMAAAARAERAMQCTLAVLDQAHAAR